jgi:hypothetical protein
MNFTPTFMPEKIPAKVSPAARPILRAVLLTAAAAVLCAAAAAPPVAPYHGRARAVFITLIPLTVGYTLGALDHAWTRRHVVPLLLAAAVVLAAAIAPGLRTDVPRLPVLAALLGGIAVAVALLRIGMLQAGIGWRNHTGNEPADYAPPWVGAVAIGFAWLWLIVALVNPRENYPPTRWLLSLTGGPPSAASRGASRVHLQRYALTGAAVTPERGLVTLDGYEFRVGPLTPGPGALQAAVSARRADGRPFGRPVWLTMDADDPARPDAANDAECFDVGALSAHGPEAASARAASSSPRVTAYAWYALSQSLPAVHLRARLWVLASEAHGRLSFRPVAEADLGTWNLTILRKFRPRI